MEDPMSTFVLPLSEPGASLESVGGKGASLAKLSAAGLPVPGGFHVTTAAYWQFITDNALQPKILSALQGAEAADPARLESISQEIAACFEQGTVPAELAREVGVAYARLGQASSAGDEICVAVRSSATAEDLPGASFAGQQETYLNICGAQDVLAAVVRCWASLWTARAIAYRARQGIAPETVALAVVVQELVRADAAGVLFTANPVSGRRDELVITATWGLGESLVGGLVTPDTLDVEKATGRVLRREIARKQVMTVRSQGGTRLLEVPEELQKRPGLSKAQVAGLAALGRQIESLYGIPMDIEWTLAGGRLAIVQARPITNLPEPPMEWRRQNPNALLARASFAEFIPDPVSPLFATLAMPIAQQASIKMMNDMMKLNRPDAYILEVVNGYVYAGFVFDLSMFWKMIEMSVAQTSKLMKDARGRWFAVREKTRQAMQKWDQEPSRLPAPVLLQGVRELFSVTAEYYTVGQSGSIGAAPFSEMVFNSVYKALVKGKADPAAASFLLGFDTISLRAEKSLFDLARRVEAGPGLAVYLASAPVEDICAALKTGTAPAPGWKDFKELFQAHLAEFGHTIYDLDFSRPVPADDPAPLIEALKTYLAGMGADPHSRQRVQQEKRQQAADAIRKRLDPLRRNWFNRLLAWAQACGPDREDCIADLGLAYPLMRRMLSELGRRLTQGGAIACPEDVYWLEAAEADALAAAIETGVALLQYMEKVEQRKALWQRERSVTPPFALPEKTVLRKLVVHDNPQGSRLKGYAASPGRVTAPACVLRGPEEFGSMRPGDVIVATTTTPAWTPLFAMAAGVVTDIGGPLSHSSIVAREYGIPAVMGTGVATKRIRSGQIITVDGTTGKVTWEEVKAAL
jgi:rifampicin phosphotransferase